MFLNQISWRNPSPSSADGSWIATDWYTSGTCCLWRPWTWCFYRSESCLWKFMSPIPIEGGAALMKIASCILRGISSSSLHRTLMLSKSSGVTGEGGSRGQSAPRDFWPGNVCWCMGKKEARKMGENWEEKKENCKREGGKLEKEVRTCFFFFYLFFFFLLFTF